jgi:Flp pilus assembly pilin Flp
MTIWRENDGAAAAEHGILLGMVALVLLLGLHMLEPNIEHLFNKASNAVSQTIYSYRSLYGSAD